MLIMNLKRFYWFFKSIYTYKYYCDLYVLLLRVIFCYILLLRRMQKVDDKLKYWQNIFKNKTMMMKEKNHHSKKIFLHEILKNAR